MTSEYPLVKSSEPEVRYFTQEKGDISHTELASLYDDNSLMGSVQLNYYTNGHRNIAHVERVYILKRYQNNEERYGSIMMHDIMQHIAEYDPSFKVSKKFESRLASDADDLEDRVSAVENRGIDRVILNCAPKLESFYEKFGFQRTDDLAMKVELNAPGYSSLE